MDENMTIALSLYSSLLYNWIFLINPRFKETGWSLKERNVSSVETPFGGCAVEVYDVTSCRHLGFKTSLPVKWLPVTWLQCEVEVYKDTSGRHIGLMTSLPVMWLQVTWLPVTWHPVPPLPRRRQSSEVVAPDVTWPEDTEVTLPEVTS